MLLHLQNVPPHLFFFQLAKPSMCSTSDIYVALQPPGRTAELCIHLLSKPEDKVIKLKTLFDAKSMIHRSVVGQYDKYLNNYKQAISTTKLDKQSTQLSRNI